MVQKTSHTTGALQNSSAHSLRFSSYLSLIVKRTYCLSSPSAVSRPPSGSHNMLNHRASSESPYSSDTARIRSIFPSMTLSSSSLTVLSITPIATNTFRLAPLLAKYSRICKSKPTYNIGSIAAAELVHAVRCFARRAHAARVAWVAAAADVACHDGAVWRWSGAGEVGESC